VPKFTVQIGGSFGAGNYALCGKAFDPRLIVAWPASRCAVMGGGFSRMARRRVLTLCSMGCVTRGTAF